MRKIVFANGEYYHIYNRGVDKRKVFLRRGHYIRFLQTIHNLLTTGESHPNPILLEKYDQSLAFAGKLSFICYCLMPNHYHFLIRQLQDHAISDFMHHLNTSYTKYFNFNNERTGRLFEYTFKAIHVETEEQLLHLSRYIHLNPLMANLTNDLKKYPWSSYPDYIGIRNGKLCRKEEILQLLSSRNAEEAYEQFVLDQADYARTLKQLEKLALD